MVARLVSHEVNNPLAVLRAWLFLLKDDSTQIPKMAERIDMLIGQVERIAQAMNNLNSFAHQRMPGRQVEATAEILRTVVALFTDGCRVRGMLLEAAFSDQLPSVQCQAVRLQEMLIILLESCRSSRGIGTIRVQAGSADGGLRIVVEHVSGRAGNAASMPADLDADAAMAATGPTAVRRMAEEAHGTLTTAAAADGMVNHMLWLPAAAGTDHENPSR